MKKSLLILAVFLLPVFAYAGDQATYQSGIDYTKDKTGGGAGGGRNLSNLSNLIQLFVANQSLNKTTGAENKSTLNDTSQSAQDINILKDYFGTSNAIGAPATADLNQPGGRGDQKKAFCRDYIDPSITPNPDPTKYAECQAVVELDGQRIKDYRAASGFSKNDAIFSANSKYGQAKKLITDTPQDQLLSTVGVGGTGGGSGMVCTTVDKVGPAQFTTGQCSRAAIPDSSSCNNLIKPKVILEKYCDAYGGGDVVSNIVAVTASSSTPWSGNLKTFVTTEEYGQVFASQTTKRFRVDYSCGPKDLDGGISTIYATITPIMPPVAHWGGCDTDPGPWPKPYRLLFAPGVSTTPVQFMYGRTGYWSGGFFSGCSVANDFATYWYDGNEDLVMIGDHNTNSEVGGGYMNSCPDGMNFVDKSAPYDKIECAQESTYDGWATVCRPVTNYAVPAHCDNPTFIDSVAATNPVVSSAPSISNWDYDAGWTYTCPATHPYGGKQYSSNWGVCFNATYSCPTISNDTWVKINIPPSGFLSTGIPDFKAGYCTRKSSINAIRPYAPAPHYEGGAGLRARLIEEVVDTCSQYQDQSLTGPSAPGGSYTPTSKVEDVCTNPFILYPQTSLEPMMCKYQPADVLADATINFTCKLGVYSATTGQCEYQAPSYQGYSSKKYVCPTGDVLKDDACPNGGTKSGQSCLYQISNATVASRSCIPGLTLVGDLCYTDMFLASTITQPNGTTVFDSIKTYSCNGADVLNMDKCEPVAQTVTCQHQPDSVPSYGIDHYNCPTGTRTGNFILSYAIADNTVQLNACVAFPVTKPASVQSRACASPYTYNSTSGACEYQMADYNSTNNKDCSANPGYTYDAANDSCYKIPAAYNAF